MSTYQDRARKLLNQLAFDAGAYGANPANGKPSVDQALSELASIVEEEMNRRLDWWKQDMEYSFVPLCSYCHRKTAKVIGQTGKGEYARNNNHRPVNWGYYCKPCRDEGMELERQAING